MAQKQYAEKIEHSLTRRKEPQQRRSELTVKSIKQATIEIAVAEGFLHLGTRRIADRAGVSIGTLYQYFPTCEAILLAIYEETASHVANKFRERMLSLMHAPIDILGGKALQLLLKEFEDNRMILHQMVIEVPHLTLAPGAASFDRLFNAGLRIYFMQFSHLSNKDVERVCFFIGSIIISSLRNYISSKPPLLSRKEFLDDLNKVVVSYIQSQHWTSPA